MSRDTPLLHAAGKGYLEIVQLLLQNNANFKAENKIGVTALQAAIAGQHETVVQMVMEKEDHGTTAYKAAQLWLARQLRDR